MIEMLEGFPEGVVAAVAKARVTRRDYEEILIPAVEAAFRRRNKVRCYYELGRDFAGMDAGAIWEDLRVGLGHLSGWSRSRLLPISIGYGLRSTPSDFCFPERFGCFRRARPPKRGGGSRPA